jgi:predicted dehydrogenase
MRKKEPLKTAIIGCGLIGQMHHIPSLCKIKEAEVAAICDVNKDVVKHMARKFNISRYYTDAAEMLGKEKVDLVDICTPPQTHFALAIQAMEKGRHVLVEKPVTLSLKEFDELASAAKRNKVQFCQVHNKLFEPVMMKAQTLVSQEGIGELTGVDIQVLLSREHIHSMLKNKEHWCHSLPAGIFSETLPHPIYLAAAFLGKVEPVGTNSRKSSNYDWVAADEIRVIVKGEKGLGTISLLCNSTQSKTILDIHGTKKHLRIDLFNSVMTEYGSGTGNLVSRARENLQQSFSISASTISTSLSVISGKFHSGHYNLIQRFIESISYGAEPPVSLQEARNVIEVMEKVAVLI